MGMNEFSSLPLLTLPPHLEAVESDLAPRLVIAEVHDHLVVFVEQRNPAVKIRHQHHVALDVNVCGEQEAAERFQVPALHVEPL